MAERFGTNALRNELLGGALRAAQHLKQVGVQDLWLDGSFTSEKENPGDYDMCFALVQADLRSLDPLLRPPLSLTQSGRAGMKRKYRGDVLPQHGAGGFLAFFQQDRGTPKGIIKIDTSTLP